MVKPQVKGEISFVCSERPDAVACGLLGAVELFEAESIADVRRDLAALLAQVTAEPQAPLGRLLAASRFLESRAAASPLAGAPGAPAFAPPASPIESLPGERAIAP